MGTSHELGQNFARVFDITFVDESGQLTHVWQTSWGVSTRLMGALVMVHGDDAGLRLPPLLAPVQVAVILVKADDGADVAAAGVAAELRAAGLRVELDARTDTSFGRRSVEWELKGVPLRVEIGPRDLATGKVVVVRRDTGTKTPLPLAGVADAVRDGLDAVHGALLAEATALQRERTVETSTVAEAEAAAATGFAVLPLATLGSEGEGALNRGGVSVRCIGGVDGALRHPGTAAEDLRAVVGRAY